MRFFSQVVCIMVAAGLLTACSGSTVMSPTSTLPNANGVRAHQTMSLPCHCVPVSPAGKRSHRRI